MILSRTFGSSSKHVEPFVHNIQARFKVDGFGTEGLLLRAVGALGVRQVEVATLLSKPDALQASLIRTRLQIKE